MKDHLGKGFQNPFQEAVKMNRERQRKVLEEEGLEIIGNDQGRGERGKSKMTEVSYLIEGAMASLT